MVNLAASTSSPRANDFLASRANSNAMANSLPSASDAYRAVTSNRAYTDLSALQDIRTLGKDDQDAALKAVAKQFESMFVGMMLSSMRQASEVMSKDSLFNSPEQKFFQSMFDDQISLSMTQGSGTGLADVIYRQMLQEYKPSPQPIAQENRQLAPLPERQGNMIIMRPAAASDSDKLELSSTGITTNITANSTADKTTDLVNRLAQRKIAATKTTDTQPLQILASINDKTAQQSAIAKNQHGSSSNSPQTTINPQTTSNSQAVSNPQAVSNSQAASHIPAEKGQWFASAQQFIAAIYPAAKQAAQQLGVDIKGILSQAALETGWGKHVIQAGDRSSFNLFGIKANSRWQGDRMSVMTHEFYDGKRINQKDSFRAYHSIEQGMQDYCQFLSQSERYQAVLAQRPSAQQYGHLLQQAGYATDPNYGAKIAQIAAGDTLNQALKTIESDVSVSQPAATQEGVKSPSHLDQTSDSLTQSMTAGGQHG